MNISQYLAKAYQNLIEAAKTQNQTGNLGELFGIDDARLEEIFLDVEGYELDYEELSAPEEARGAYAPKKVSPIAKYLQYINKSDAALKMTDEEQLTFLLITSFQQAKEQEPLTSSRSQLEEFLEQLKRH